MRWPLYNRGVGSQEPCARRSRLSLTSSPDLNYFPLERVRKMKRYNQGMLIDTNEKAISGHLRSLVTITSDRKYPFYYLMLAPFPQCRRAENVCHTQPTHM